MKHGSKKASRKRASRQLLYIVLGFALGLAGLTGLVYAVMPGRADLGSPAIGGSFTMIEQDGRVVLSCDPERSWFRIAKASLISSTRPAVFKALGPDKKVAALFVTAEISNSAVGQKSGQCV
jgi:hypothetical protein